MATVKLKLRKDKLNALGEMPLVLVVRHNGQKRIKSIGVKTKLENWNSSTNRIKPSDKKSLRKNNLIRIELDRIESKIDQLLISRTPFSINDIVPTAVIKPNQNSLNNVGKDNLNNMLVSEYSARYIKENPTRLSYGTLKYYQSALKAWVAFNHPITFADFTQTIIKDFETYLINNGLKINTVHSRLKVFKRICNYAYGEEHISMDVFKKYRLKREVGKRDYLTEKELVSILELRGLSEKDNLVKELFLFSALGTGLRFSDMLTIRNKNVEIKKDSYRIKLVMNKTRKTLDLLILGYPKKLINKYYKADSPDAFMFPILDNNKEYTNETLLNKVSSYNAMCNKKIKVLVKLVNIEKHVSMHVARHSFASYALENDMKLVELQQHLGHANISETMIYSKLTTEKKDRSLSIFNKFGE